MSMRSVLTSGSCLSPPAPPPPPPPGPPPIFDTDTVKDEGTASRSALFAQLNQGEAITKGQEKRNRILVHQELLCINAPSTAYLRYIEAARVFLRRALRLQTKNLLQKHQHPNMFSLLNILKSLPFTQRHPSNFQTAKPGHLQPPVAGEPLSCNCNKNVSPFLTHIQCFRIKQVKRHGWQLSVGHSKKALRIDTGRL